MELPEPGRATQTRVKQLHFFGALFLAVQLAARPAVAEDAPSYNGLWIEATKTEGCTPKDFPDFIMGVCPDKLTFWYFTKPNHPAHPGVIKRQLVQKSDGWHMGEHGSSFAPDSRQQAFKDWLAQFQELDRQMKDYIARKKSPPA